MAYFALLSMFTLILEAFLPCLFMKVGKEVMFFEGELRQSLTSAVVDARLDQGERRFTPQ